MRPNCPNCGRFHKPDIGCLNSTHRRNPAVLYDTMPKHGQSLLDAVPRLRRPTLPLQKVR